MGSAALARALLRLPMMRMAALGLSMLGWGGCGNEPVEPPATPPAERAPELHLERATPALPDLLYIDANRKLG
jgi:hypothetical protein